MRMDFFFASTDNEQGRPHVFAKNHTKRSSYSSLTYWCPEHPHLIEIHVFNQRTCICQNVQTPDLINVIAKIIQNKVLDVHLKKKENPYGDYKNDNSIQRTYKKIKSILMIYRNMFKKITNYNTKMTTMKNGNR